MLTPRAPSLSELPKLMEFLNHSLRPNSKWSIQDEYPTALNTQNIHNMRIITENDQIASHAVLKIHILKTPHLIFKVGAIGSVVTGENFRQRGFSSSVLQECLNLAYAQDCDVAILWTNLFDFYRKFNFELAGSEQSLLLENTIKVGDAGLRFSKDKNISAEAILRLYNQHSTTSLRNSDDIKKFMNIPNTQIYTAWEKDNTLAAYAVEGKGADLTGYIHEWGGSVSKLLSLIEYIQKERGPQLTLIAPKHAQNLISQLKGLGAICNPGYLGMIKIIHFDQLAAKIKKAFRNQGITDIVLERQGPGFIFGCQGELFTLQTEADVTRFLFGPYDWDQLPIQNQNVKQKLSSLIPLPLWIWGWDSI